MLRSERFSYCGVPFVRRSSLEILSSAWEKMAPGLESRKLKVPLVGDFRSRRQHTVGDDYFLAGSEVRRVRHSGLRWFDNTSRGSGVNIFLGNEFMVPGGGTESSASACTDD